MEIKIKVWIEKDGKAVFGGGRAELLSLVRQTGSLNKAAKAMRMSYRAAWGKIKDTEARIGYPLLETRTGGEKGGGSRLTPAGEKLLDSFVNLEKKLGSAAKRSFDLLFGLK